MGVFSDLERRTGVGVGGVLLYVVLLGAVIGGVESVGDIPSRSTGRVGLLPFLPGLLAAVGLLGVVSAVSNFGSLLGLAAARRGWNGSAHVGAATPVEGTLESPVEGRDALCYTYRILENGIDDEPGPEDEENWSLAAMGFEHAPFGLRADARQLRVEADGADVHIAGTEEAFLAADEAEPDALAALRGKAGVERASGTAYRFQESVLAPGDEAFVRWEDSPEDAAAVVADADYPDRVRDRVVSGLLLGVPTTALGVLGLLFVAGAL